VSGEKRGGPPVSERGERTPPICLEGKEIPSSTQAPDRHRTKRKDRKDLVKEKGKRSG